MAATLLAMAWCSQAAEKVSFTAKDGLEVTADLSMPRPSSAPLILLFHQAGAGRGEYLAITDTLNELGFNTLAVDLRSGGGSGGLSNETAARARAARKPMGYLDALPDLLAAIAWAKGRAGEGGIILWGSSYSASLVLKIAGDDPEACRAVLAFSPGEYFGRSDLILESARKIRVPVFVTSGKYEKAYWEEIFAAIPSPGKLSFIPGATGAHGSEALWPGTAGSQEYWDAVKPFLAGLR